MKHKDIDDAEDFMGCWAADEFTKQRDQVIELLEQCRSQRTQIDLLAKFIMAEVPGHPSGSVGATDAAIAAIAEYQRAAQFLWQILDDISTYDDACKGKNAVFREHVGRLVEKRSLQFQSDGYKLYRVVEQSVLLDPEPNRTKGLAGRVLPEPTEVPIFEDAEAEEPEEPEEDEWWQQPAHRVTSSNLVAARYLVRGSYLEVAFKGGGVYRYKEVPQSMWADFQAAKSKGRFLNQHIKPAFKYEKIDG